MTVREELLQQLCHDLRLLWTEAGGPSLRTLSTRAGLGRSQLSAILNGKIRHPPDWEVIKAVIDSVRQYSKDHNRSSRLSLRTGVDEYWRPRYALLEHAFQQSPRRGLSASRVSVSGIPRQLPTAVTHFVGRSGELAVLTGLLEQHTGNTGPVVISAIGGTAGVGKTTLAVHWAHRVCERFPDGQLYVNLRGFGPADSVLEPAAVIRRFLEGLGVAPQRFPADPDALAALYRTELAGRRVLIVLDNARDSAQVSPLLPGAAHCLVLVTSRNQLSGLLSTYGARVISLDLLSGDEARDLLAHRLGRDRLSVERDAIDDIISSCARLPLALSVVAAQAANQPNLPLHALASELAQANSRLDALTTDDPATDARTVFSWSYNALAPEAARLFRLLGLHPGPDFTAAVAASLAALDPPQTRKLLVELTRSNLLAQHVPGRYAFHDLLHAYAAEQVDAVDSHEERHAALHRMLDHYQQAAYAVASQLHAPALPKVVPPPPQEGVILVEVPDLERALDWFDTERAVLLVILSQAMAAEFDTIVFRLGCYFGSFLFRQGHWSDEVAVHRAAVDAARRLADPRAEAGAHGNLANAYLRMGGLDDAREHYCLGLDLSTRAGALDVQALLEGNFAALYDLQDRHVEALEHVQNSARLFEMTGDRLGFSRALQGVAETHIRLGNHNVALATCRRALAVQLELGDKMGLARTWNFTGRAYGHLGQYVRAIEKYELSLALHRELGFRYDEAETLSIMGDARRAMGDHAAAREAWQSALGIFDQLRHADADQVRAKLAALDGGT